MMIKANGEYLDFQGDITLEKQIKLFEDISSTDGDFSYAFELQKTIQNSRILQSPFPDNTTKQVYQKIPAELLSDDGLSISSGYLRIERITDVYECSFFSGNNNWFALLDGTLNTLDFSDYEEDLENDVIIDSWARTEGVKYPLVDAGNLSTRSNDVYMLLDFVPFVFVHTIFERLFSEIGIKIQGELLDEPRYQKMMITNSSVSQNEITARSSNAQKDFQNFISGGLDEKLTFPVDSPLPYFDGSQNNYDTSISRYTADIKMLVNVEFALNFSGNILFAWSIVVNGVFTVDGTLDGAGSQDSTKPLLVYKSNILLDAGDTIEIWGRSVLITSDVTSGYFKVTPTILYKSFTENFLPKWTKQDFVSNVFKLFNVISSYDNKTKTLTMNLFENIKSKEPIDISEFVESSEVDYAEFISNYYKKNNAIYQQPSIEEVEEYNDSNLVTNGGGSIEVDNDFLGKSGEFIASDFSAPFDYYNAVFDSPLARLNFNTLELGDNFAINTINDDSGTLEIEVPSGHGIRVGDLVRIKDSLVLQYNGDWAVSAVTATTIHPREVSYAGDADFTLTKLNTVRNASQDVFIAIDSGPQDMADFTGKPFILISHDETITGSGGDRPSLAYFNMPDVNKPINDLVQGAAFGRGNNQLSYQQTLLESYYHLFGKILQDPVMLKPTAYIPYKVFLDIDFLRPVYIKSIESVNMYYLNRITGYDSSFKPCTLELIKI